MYRVVHSFYTNKKMANTQFASVKSKWPSVELEEDNDGHYAIVFLRTDSYEEAVVTLHKVFNKGLWCGIEEI